MSRISVLESEERTRTRVTGLTVSAPGYVIARRGTPAQRLGKRSLDVGLALAALLVFGPAMFFTAVLIWTSGGPALFRQERIGAGGKPFQCLKFRTMCVDADARLRDLLARDPDARAEWERSQKLRKDPRITWIGRFLRKSSIDELPQLFNVLRGEMSVVGPRPIVHAEIERYGKDFHIYASVPPGITGLWQISGRSGTTYADRVHYDKAYVEGWSLAGDIRIILKTIPAVLMGDGAS